jgi:hypothetical protein
MSRFVSVGVLVKELGLCPETWRRLADGGKVRCAWIGRQRRFDFTSAETYLKAGGDGPPALQLPISADDRMARFLTRHESLLASNHVESEDAGNGI